MSPSYPDLRRLSWSGPAASTGLILRQPTPPPPDFAPWPPVLNWRWTLQRDGGSAASGAAASTTTGAG